jgi:AcrR family transcriptional regulator
MPSQTKRKLSSAASTGFDESVRLEILRAAAEAFMKNGFAATSIDTVAETLGATKGRVYYYYKSKADLFFDVYREAMRINLETIKPLAKSDQTPSERLSLMAHAHLMLILEHFPFQRVATQGIEMHLSGSTTPDQRKALSALIAARDRYEQMFVDVVSEGIATGEFAGGDPRLKVKAILGTLNWITIWYRPKPGETGRPSAQFADEFVSYITRGLRSPNS